MTAPLSSERWQRLQGILAEVLETNVENRTAILEKACGGDAALRREVESLLDTHQQPGLLDDLASKVVAPALSAMRALGSSWEGQLVAQYRVLEAVGAGGMGVLHKARDDRLGRLVALKCLAPTLGADSSAKRRFLVEARAAAALDHPNVCGIHEIGETADGQLFIAMPFYEGETLRARLERGPLSFDEALAIALQTARGLAAAHDRGIVHRDIKPANVMLLRDDLVKVLDFGIAKVENVSMTASGAPLGTVAYMSPEQARGETVDHRTDIWSLGAVLYEMLTGAPPFRAQTIQGLLYAILTRTPEPVSMLRHDVPTAVDDLMARALARALDRRFPTMRVMIAALESLVPLSGPPAPAREQPAMPAWLQDDHTPLPAAGERRRATIVLSTLAGYGGLLERVGPEEAERVVQVLRDIVVDTVRRQGGMVNESVGPEIVSLFGVPVAHEDDYLRALQAASEYHARARDLGLAAGVPPGFELHVQSGVHTGTLVIHRLREGPRRYGLSGAAAHVPAQLAALAAPDDILLSPETQRLVSPFGRTEPVAPVVLQAGMFPVTPYRFTGRSGVETRLEAAERSGLTPFTGRDAELGVLLDHLELARKGEGRLVLVLGEAGAGKSRLLHELRRRVDTGMVSVFQGRCRPHGGPAPYLPFIEILQSALDLGHEARQRSAVQIVRRLQQIDDSLDPFLPLYLHLLGVQHDEFPLPLHLHDAEHLQTALGEALAAFLSVLARDHATVVLAEDWHWADGASREALQRIQDIIAAQHLLMIVTSRPDADAPYDRLESAAFIQLRPLDQAGSAAIMRSVLRVPDVPAALAERLHQRTGGNPFFLEELCQALLEQEAGLIHDGFLVPGRVEALGLPDTVQAVIRARLDRMDPEALEVVRVASVIGREFGMALLADVMEPGLDASPALERLKRAGLIQQTSVVPEPRYRFKHALTQEVTYESLLDYETRRLHEKVGRALERRHPGEKDRPSGDLAYHFSRAEAWTEAVTYGLEAAARATALSDYAGALSLLEQVHGWMLKLPENHEQRRQIPTILLERERLCEILGLPDRQQQIIDELIALVAPQGLSEALAQAYVRQGDLSTLRKRYEEAERVLETALRISRERADLVLERKTLRSLELLRCHQGRWPDALALAERALAISRDQDDESALTAEMCNIGSILRNMGEYERALEMLERAAAKTAGPSDADRRLPFQFSRRAHVLYNLGQVYSAVGDLDRALEQFRRADELAGLLGLLPRRFYLSAVAHVQLRQGRVDDALQTYGEVIDLCRRARNADGLAHALLARAEVELGLGRNADALSGFAEAVRLFEQLGNPDALTGAWTRMAAIHEGTGAHAQAMDAWSRIRALRAAAGDRSGELEAVEGLARSVRQLNATPEEIAARFEEALGLAVALGERRRESSLRNTLGILAWNDGRLAEALRHYEAALRICRETGDRVHEGLILNSVGVTLQRASRYEEARTALEEALDVNRSTGERLLEAHSLAALGDVSLALGRPEAACEAFDQALSIRRALHDRTGEGWMLHRLSTACAARGDHAAADAAAEGAAAIAAESGDPALARACGLQAIRNPLH
jgi:tetratricopeptide (TPR) repeat protein/class 3 adenylate cyclase